MFFHLAAADAAAASLACVFVSVCSVYMERCRSSCPYKECSFAAQMNLMSQYIKLAGWLDDWLSTLYNILYICVSDAAQLFHGKNCIQNDSFFGVASSFIARIIRTQHPLL
jgi:hypothetical protein